MIGDVSIKNFIIVISIIVIFVILTILFCVCNIIMNHQQTNQNNQNEQDDENQHTNIDIITYNNVQQDIPENTDDTNFIHLRELQNIQPTNNHSCPS